LTYIWGDITITKERKLIEKTGFSEFRYSGRDNLELMSLAVNYNNAIYRWVSEGIRVGSRVLEFGAGTGEYCNRISGAFVSAVELDRDLHRAIKCEVFTHLSEINESYDLIYSLNVLEHILDEDSVISRFHQLLNSRGRLKILVPARKELFSRMDDKVGHLRRYTKKGLMGLLKRNDFSVTECRYFDFMGYFTTLVYKIIGNDDSFNEKTILFYDRIVFPVGRIIDRVTYGKVLGKNIMIDAAKR
jgi:SAM-dependent methyltransferase